MDDRTRSIRRLLFVALPMLMLSCSSRDKAGIKLTEDGEKVKINNITPAYMPRGTYQLAPDEAVSKIDITVFQDVKRDGNWAKIVGPKLCAVIEGKWLLANGTISPMIADGKYRMEITMKYYKRNDPKTLLTKTEMKEFVY